MSLKGDGGVTNNIVDLKSPAPLNNQASLVLDFMTPLDADNMARMEISKKAVWDDSNGFWIDTWNSTSCTCSGSGGNWRTLTFASSAPRATRFRCVFVFNGATVKLYVNGILTDSDTTDTLVSNNRDITLGANDTYSFLNSFFVYNRALSPSAIQSLYVEPYQFIESRKIYIVGAAGYQAYSRGDYASLPANDDDLTTNYSAGDVAEVALNNEVYVNQSAIENHFAIHQFKDHVGAGNFSVTWNGQTSLAPLTSPVYLQIYHRAATTEWVTIATKNTGGADTDFTLTADITVDPDHYKDGNGIISCRVYQEY
jgi:hypothetical protein